MALLIDGYNLLHVTDIFGGAGAGTDLYRSRLALLDFLAAALDDHERPQTTIVFDAAGAPPGLPRTLAHNGMTIHFARRHANADELIEELLEEYKAPRGLTVVSSDHRVQRAARRRGASYIDSEHWYADLKTSRVDGNDTAESMIKPQGSLAGDEVSHWLNEFTTSSPEEPADSPFPPGYADDLCEDE
jgi:predicted RNA-binding protein with PIN domain